MIKVGITGIDGFLGWHLRSFLRSRPEIEIIEGGGRQTFSDESLFKSFVSSSDVIVHLAGMNRGADKDIRGTNIKLASDLLRFCDETASRPHIIFASSTHIFRKSAYGESKKRCSRLFKDWAKRNKVNFSNLIIPNIFGEYGKPFYNSVVATFCHQIANGLEPKIIKDNTLELVHAQDVAMKIYEAITGNINGDTRVTGLPLTVKEVLGRIVKVADIYKSQVIPDLNDPFSLNLFNTYRSYLYPSLYPVKVDLHADNRGQLFETVKSLSGGQCFISSSKPNITRGEHYHLKKMERFFVIKGQGLLRIRKLFNAEVVEFKMDENNHCYVDIPTLHTHSITNVGESDLLVLFWSNQIYSPDTKDTFFEKV